jgi:hypothetical protein
MPDEEIATFLEDLSTHDVSVPTDDREAAYNTLREATDDFESVTAESLATAIEADGTVVRETLRLSANFHSLDSWRAPAIGVATRTLLDGRDRQRDPTTDGRRGVPCRILRVRDRRTR